MGQEIGGDKVGTADAAYFMGVEPAAPDNTHPVRARILDALGLIASFREVLVARPGLSPERLSFLLCRMWFDEVYVPGRRYLDGLKGDFDPVAAERVLALFDEDEQRWLERFNRFLELRVAALGTGPLNQGIFPVGERWESVIRDAGYLVELLGGNLRSGTSLDERIVALLDYPTTSP